MTPPERISTPRATPSVAPAGAPKAAATASTGAEDFAKTLTQARGPKDTPSANNTPPAKANAKAEAAAKEVPSESAPASSASRSAKTSRGSRDPKETETSAEGEAAEATANPGQLPAEVIAALNEAQGQPTPAPVRASQEGEQPPAPSSGETDRAALVIAATVTGVTTRSAESSAPADTLSGQGSTAASIAPSDTTSSRQLPNTSLVTTSELRPKPAQGQGIEQSAQHTALAVVTDALQSAVSAADGNAASGAGAVLLANTAPDAAANAALSQLTAAVSSSDPASLTRNAPSIAQHTLQTPVGARGWNDELATRLTWMVDQRQQVATLRLSPENLGPVEVRIDVRENQVSVWFGAAQADTRAAIESALPRLREMLQGQGLSLADAGVFQQSHRESTKHSSTPQGSMFGEAESAGEMTVARRVGLFDGYA